MIAKCKNILINLFVNKSICILGVDGTGKSSATAALKKYIGQTAEIQYMGLHSYLTRYARMRYGMGNQSKGRFSVLKNFIALYIEMWYRIIRHWPHPKIIIYDRYTWEFIIPLKGIKKIAAKLLYKTFFPKPRYAFYLYCPVEVSLSRKNDIDDVAGFIDMKNSYDAAFLNSRKIISIDTSINDINDVIKKISSSLPSHYNCHINQL